MNTVRVYPVRNCRNVFTSWPFCILFLTLLNATKWTAFAHNNGRQAAQKSIHPPMTFTSHVTTWSVWIWLFTDDTFDRRRRQSLIRTFSQLAVKLKTQNISLSLTVNTLLLPINCTPRPRPPPAPQAKGDFITLVQLRPKEGKSIHLASGLLIFLNMPQVKEWQGD